MTYDELVNQNTINIKFSKPCMLEKCKRWNSKHKFCDWIFECDRRKKYKDFYEPVEAEK